MTAKIKPITDDAAITTASGKLNIVGTTPDGTKKGEVCGKETTAVSNNHIRVQVVNVSVVQMVVVSILNPISISCAQTGYLAGDTWYQAICLGGATNFDIAGIILWNLDQ